MLASIMETIIFMFMGLSTVSDTHSWNTGFIIVTIVSCTVYRIIGVIILANIANRWRLLELTMTDMLIMSYGGIRGAVAFALALILDEKVIPRKKEFVTATIAVVFWTVFLQGTTIGPVVKYFKVKRKEEEDKGRTPQPKSKQGGPRPQGGRAGDDPGSSPRPAHAPRTFPNKPINVTTHARGRVRQSRRAKLRSRQGALTGGAAPAWWGSDGPSSLLGLWCEAGK